MSGRKLCVSSELSLKGGLWSGHSSCSLYRLRRDQSNVDGPPGFASKVDFGGKEFRV